VGANTDIRSDAGEGWGLSITRTAGAVRADLSLALIEALIIVVSYIAAMSVRFVDSPSGVPTGWWRGLLLFLPILLIVHIGTNALFGNYGHVWKYASIDEAVRLFAATMTAGAILGAALVIWRIAGGDGPIPVSVLVIGLLLTSAGMGAVRFWSRLFAYRRYGESGLAERALVVGVGEDAVRLARHRSHAQGAICVVGFLDPSKKLVDPRRKLAGLQVFGDLNEVAKLVERLDVDQVIIATDDAGNLSRRVVDLCMEIDVRLRIVPNMDALLDDSDNEDMRDLRLTDLLSRQQVQTDLAGVERLIADRVVLITGAGGSIGSELLRQILSFGPAKLVALDRDETLLHEVSSVSQNASLVTELADIRDEARVRSIFEKHRPELVFHAAAHKHVPILEDYPSEAAKTNVAGTSTVIDAARSAGTDRLVVISTDKAVDPSSVMGASKRVAEMLVQAGTDTGGAPRMCAVRFGNVLGSRGSVVPTFTRQIKAGGPVTVSDPEMERYFMTVTEAVELVLQASVLSEGGEVFVLDMGRPVRILDLAHRMIRLAGLVPDKDVLIEITGKRPGEKSTEILSIDPLQQTDHEKVLVAQPAHPGAASLAIGLDLLHRSLEEGNEAEIRERIMEIASNDWAEIEIDLRDGQIGLTPTSSSDGAQSRW
jgi:FlaA1/EpsC-like NDP-sugar epimerase